MTDIPRKTRDSLLSTLDAVLKELREVRAKTQPADSGSERAESTLLSCRGAVDTSRDVGQLIHTLKMAAGGLKGDASAAIKRARTTLETLWTALELTG